MTSPLFVDPIREFVIRGEAIPCEDQAGANSVNLSGDAMTPAAWERLASLGVVVSSLQLRECGVSDDDLVHLRGLGGLGSLDLAGNPVSDDGLHALTALEELYELNLAQTRVQGWGLQYLPGGLASLDLRGAAINLIASLRTCGRLRHLHLASSALDDSHFELLGHLPLVELTATGTRMTGAGLAYLGSSLERLDLSGSPIVDSSAEHIARCGGLTWLSVSGTELTSDSLPQLATLHALQELDLSNTRIAGAGLAELPALTDLRVLDLQHTPNSEQDLLPLATMTRLRELRLCDRRILQEARARLKKRLRNLGQLDISRCHRAPSSSGADSCRALPLAEASQAPTQDPDSGIALHSAPAGMQVYALATVEAPGGRGARSGSSFSREQLGQIRRATRQGDGAVLDERGATVLLGFASAAAAVQASAQISAAGARVFLACGDGDGGQQWVDACFDRIGRIDGQWPVVATAGVLEVLSVPAVELGAIKLPASKRWGSLFALGSPPSAESDAESILLAVACRFRGAIITRAVDTGDPFAELRRVFRETLVRATDRGLRLASNEDCDVLAYSTVDAVVTAITAIDAELAEQASILAAGYALDVCSAPMQDGRALGLGLLQRMVGVARPGECMARLDLAERLAEQSSLVSHEPTLPMRVKGRADEVEIAALSFSGPRDG